MPVRLSRSSGLRLPSAWTTPSVRVHARAQHDRALVASVVARAAAHRRAPVPYQDVADAPAASARKESGKRCILRMENRQRVVRAAMTKDEQNATGTVAARIHTVSLTAVRERASLLRSREVQAFRGEEVIARTQATVRLHHDRRFLSDLGHRFVNRDGEQENSLRTT